MLPINRFTAKRKMLAFTRISAIILVLLYISNKFILSQTGETIFEYHSNKKLSIGTHPNKKLVIIISEYRGGSTFISELFNQRDDTAYFFEPLWAMEPWFPWRPVDVSDKFTKRILKQTLLNCSFVDPTRLPEPEWSPTQYIQPWEWEHCKTNKICFRERMKLVLDEPLCPKELFDEQMCYPTDVNKFNEECMEKQILSTKILRLCSLHDLEEFFVSFTKKISDLKQNENFPISDVHVIYEVRDPRAVLNSRREIHKYDNVTWDFDMCDCSKKNIEWFEEFGREKALGANLTMKVFPVRYEDLALRPKKTTAEIYKFVGVGFPKKIKQWIEVNTKDDGSRAMCDTTAEEMVDKALDNMDEEEMLEEINFDAVEFHPEMECFYSTKRDSKKAVSRWVSSLGQENMELLEKLESCRMIMDTYGYKNIEKIPDGDSYEADTPFDEKIVKKVGEGKDDISLADLIDVNFKMKF